MTSTIDSSVSFTSPSDPPSRSRSSTKLATEDVTSLTSFNPFSEEDEHDQSSYAIVTNLFSRMRSSLAAPLAATTTPAASQAGPAPAAAGYQEQRRPSATALNTTQSSFSSKSNAERPSSLTVNASTTAPPLVSLTPVISNPPVIHHDPDRSPLRGGYTPVHETQDGDMFGTAIPGFAIPDDARSIKTSVSINRSASVSKVMRRIRGEGLSKDYWMDDETAKECYDCKSVFTTWRRKHHCRICGQIFCARCASNIIKGSRFGQDGMVRVCNLCLEKLATVEDREADDDSRSVVSFASTPHSLAHITHPHSHAHVAHHATFHSRMPADEGMPSAGGTLSLAHHPQSPFAASQLFGRTDEPFSLYSIAETKRPLSGSEENGFGSRPLTPAGWWGPSFANGGDPGESSATNTAPFRRHVADEEKESNSGSAFAGEPHTPNKSSTPNQDGRNGSTAGGSRAKTPVDFPVMVPAGEMSSIQFPISSPEAHGPESPHGLMRQRFDSYEGGTPFIRSRVQSRMDSFAAAEGWRTRRDSTAYAQELNLISMFHLRVMLRQMLATEQIADMREWEETLLKLALRVARELTFTTSSPHEGADMDVRRYVKIKKIPGARPRDSEYVDGAVITKNVAHKKMALSQRHPRVMCVAFPLEFHRVEGQYVHFGQVLRQEREYLGNLASRIAALRPHVVLVEQSVSRIALDALVKANISVARAVKPSALALVARMTQGDVLGSMDRLALEPRLGMCARFRVQTFEHALIPGRRKTYMRFEGCSRDMGCTLVLRGGDVPTLRRVKKVARFLMFVVRNLKLETHLWKDSVITLPSLSLEAVPNGSNQLFGQGERRDRDDNSPALITSVSFVRAVSPGPTSLPQLSRSPSAADSSEADDGDRSRGLGHTHEATEDGLPESDAQRLRLSKRIDAALQPYTRTFISVSATLRFLPPYPIRRMKELDEELWRAQRAWEDEIVRREEMQARLTQGPVSSFQPGGSGSDSRLQRSASDMSIAGSVASPGVSAGAGATGSSMSNVSNVSNAGSFETNGTNATSNAGSTLSNASVISNAGTTPTPSHTLQPSTASVATVTNANAISTPSQETPSATASTMSTASTVTIKNANASPAVSRENTSTSPPSGVNNGVDATDVRAQIEALPIPGLLSTPQTPTQTSELTTDGYFGPQPSSSINVIGGLSLVASPRQFTPAPIQQDEFIPLKSENDIALESQLELIKFKHEEFRRIWEWYLRKNTDDFIIEKYQFINVWIYTVPIEDFGMYRSCGAPRQETIVFYGEHDTTLGQFIERSVMETLVQFLDPKAVCTSKECDQPLARHCKVYAHNESRVAVAIELWDGQISGRSFNPAPDLITTWSACRVCGSATPFIPVSEEMQRYSFAKFLELYFYPADVQLVQGAGCQHNIYQHHIRYFAAKGMTVRFQADPVVLYEVVFPPTRIRVKPETQLALKNQDYEEMHWRNMIWYSALVEDLKMINIDAATGEDDEQDLRLTVEINQLILRAEAERREISQLLNQVYRDAAPTDTLAMNKVRSFRQDRIVAWQGDFDKLPKPRGSIIDRSSGASFTPGSGAGSSARRTAYGTMRAMWPRKVDLRTKMEMHVPGSSVSESEGFLSRRRATTSSMISSASEASSEPETDDTVETDKTVETPSIVEVPPAAAEIEKRAEMADVLVSEPSEILSGPGLKRADSGGSESDSTIGATTKGDGVLSSDEQNKSTIRRQNGTSEESERPATRLSRLPRRPAHHPSVAELVKRYQDFLPPQGVEELAKTALSPTPPPNASISESEPEYSEPPVRRTGPRVKAKQHPTLSKKASTSDFEQSYAANAASRHLTSSRRNLVHGPRTSRIPAPVGVPEYQATVSRAKSPEKVPSRRPTNDGYESPHQSTKMLGVPSGGRTLKGKSSSRNLGKDKEKQPSRPGSSSGSKQPFRRQPPGPMNKVGNLARQFERITRESELQMKRRYSVIRRRARPVTNARAKVEVLDSIKDAIKDESESSDSSSEVGDEGGDEDEGPKSTDQATMLEPSPEQSITLPDMDAKPHDEKAPHPVLDTTNLKPATDGNNSEPESATRTSKPSELIVPQLPEPPHSMPNSPPSRPSQLPLPLTPPPDSDGFLDRPHSIFQRFWAPPIGPGPSSRRSEFEGDALMPESEHIFRDSSMVVRINEPTSIIALALNSPQYRDMLTKSRADKRTAREPKLTDGGEAFRPDDVSVADSTSSWGVVNLDSSDTLNLTEELKSTSSKLPWAISFESGGLTISCTVLYPEQFDALRRTFDCEKSMVESLARCVNWNAKGGKSGSAFLKTQDERFIAKELSKAELQTMETFAPAYFDYMAASVSGNRPTLLAKVFGCFKLTFRKTKDKGSSKNKLTYLNLLVMENLFHNRHFTMIYDLKGSTRNRHVRSTGREDEVLLDENLVESVHLAPLYLREHSKRILRGALYNDSKFLADINVMDYSLVVGVDNAKNELVVGIVDYIRTYTWDKKLESWVKESAFLGGGKGEPTIVTPKQYRQRFLGAMERYFPLVADRWTKRREPEEEDANNASELWPDW